MKKSRAKRVYILGEARGSYRIQNFAKLLLDDRHHYKMYYDTLFYSNPILRYLKSLLINPWVILRSDVVYVNTLNVDVNIFYEMLWAKILRKYLIVDFYVSVYDTVVLDRKWFKEDSFLAKLAILCDKLFLNLGNKIVFLARSYGEYSVKLAGVKKELPSVIIPWGIEEKEPIRSGFVYGERDTLNICWWGSYQPLHGLETIIKAIPIVKESELPVRWYFFGNDDNKAKPYIDLIKELHIDDVCFLANDYTFANGKLDRFLEENCDVVLGQFGNTGKAAYLTNKLIEACAMKCTILVGDYEGFREYFNDDSVFFCGRSPEELAQKVIEIYHTDRIILRERKEKSYYYYKAQFTVPLFVENMKKLLAGTE